MSVVSAGQRFMTDLLVSSLMAGGGLETALDTAFRKETLQVDDDKVGHLPLSRKRHCNRE